MERRERLRRVEAERDRKEKLQAGAVKERKIKRRVQEKARFVSDSKRTRRTSDGAGFDRSIYTCRRRRGLVLGSRNLFDKVKMPIVSSEKA